MPNQKFFISQFPDVSPMKLMRRQRFLRRMERKLRYKEIKDYRIQHRRTKASH